MTILCTSFLVQDARLLPTPCISIESYLSSYEIAVGKTLGVNAKIVADNSAAQPLSVSVSAASLNVMTPSGNDIVIPMNDEGRDGDLQANDGIYGGSLQINTPGQYVVQP